MDHENDFNSTSATATAPALLTPTATATTAKNIPSSTTTMKQRHSDATPIGYIVTGRAAHGRVARLFRQIMLARHLPHHRRWVDLSPYGDADATIPNMNSNHRNNCHDDPVDHSVDHPAANHYDHHHPLSIPVAFIWENAPRSCTRFLRDDVLVYSHLPNGIQLMDDKWALARLLSPTRDAMHRRPDVHFVALESHCFRGREFDAFAERVGLLPEEESMEADVEMEMERNATNSMDAEEEHRFQDLTDPPSSLGPPPPPPPPKNLWVVKDASSNGAGGIWIVDPTNVRTFLSSKTASSATPLHPDHRYVAQRYAWPPVLYRGRKCHVRVYGLLAADGKAYVHRRAFLHVANDAFRVHNNNNNKNKEETSFEASVHITNCCANSHDADKFAGEIAVDLATPGPFCHHDEDHAGDANANFDDEAGFDPDENDIPLGDYLPSIAASLAALAERSSPFLRGGEANSGFEYLGLDFVLSSVDHHDDEDDDAVMTMKTKNGIDPPPHRGRRRRRPVAYLLEVNCPPSQDTATGLARAERVHDEVLSDLLKLMVLPRLGTLYGGKNENDGAECGGWMCVYAPPPPLSAQEKVSNCGKKTVPMAPSKAAIVNRIRWAMFERRAAKEYYEADGGGNATVCKFGIDPDESSSDPKERRPTCDDNGGLPTEECPNPCDDHEDATSASSFVRSRFPYFAIHPDQIFLESGGGSQVPDNVTKAVTASLSHRDRSVVGAACLRRARRAVASLLMGRSSSSSIPRHEENVNNHANLDNHDDEDVTEDWFVMMGANATSLLDLLARKYTESGVLAPGDEIVVASENHLANVHPWLRAAETLGCRVKWWTLTDTHRTHPHPDDNNNDDDDDNITNLSSSSSPSESSLLSALITDRTKIVAVSHASNMLGCLRDIPTLCSFVRAATDGYGRVIVDGVAAAPHMPSSRVFSDGTNGPDWYVASLHKMYGPHLGCLLGRREAVTELCSARSMSTTLEIYKSWELGTVNYEACAGACALEDYFCILSKHVSVGELSHLDVQPANERTGESSIDSSRPREAVPPPTGENGEVASTVDAARTWIRTVEDTLLRRLLGYLQHCAPDVRIVEDANQMKITPTQYSNVDEARLPIVSFVHARIPSRDIVQHCREHGIICRSCKFLSTERLWRELKIEDEDVVRFSLAHYNTLEEVDKTIRVLESMDDWTA